jgi:hypothetical protein
MISRVTEEKLVSLDIGRFYASQGIHGSWALYLTKLNEEIDDELDLIPLSTHYIKDKIDICRGHGRYALRGLY